MAVSMPRPMSVILVETNRLYADALVEQLRLCPWTLDICLVDSAEGALRQIRSHPTDLVLMSVAAQSPQRTLSAWRELVSKTNVVAIGVGESDDEVICCAELGVVGLLDRSGGLIDLEHLVDSVSRGESSCSPKVTAALLRRVASTAQQRTERPLCSIDRLSRREREVLRLIELGWTNKEIGRSLSIEVRTVKNHVHNLLQKLEVSRRAEAAARLRDVRDHGVGEFHPVKARD